MNLPSPTRRRWQPPRSGLVNLYRFDQEEFWFEDGRLLLRGNNGSGKSRVLANEVMEACGALPWQMGADDYRDGRKGEPLEGRPVAARWDDDLSKAMTEDGRAVHEEPVLDGLLADLASAACATTPRSETSPCVSGGRDGATDGSGSSGGAVPDAIALPHCHTGRTDFGVGDGFRQ